ncbi:hypothetical protein M404DRAFT_629377 [Pisolithus tinctorius Marx 270]|uniref:Uncharacterized protein n=1 Tax=Pisolithus tinctorius Marx 270 TaxID=870435 RepID=A0A0C3P6I8_PISTI|nr:hypothetical protein M404DRAFT_629377 [Pisolithus tinctorius Marx 270]
MGGLLPVIQTRGSANFFRSQYLGDVQQLGIASSYGMFWGMYKHRPAIPPHLHTRRDSAPHTLRKLTVCKATSTRQPLKHLQHEYGLEARHSMIDPVTSLIITYSKQRNERPDPNKKKCKAFATIGACTVEVWLRVRCGTSSLVQNQDLGRAVAGRSRLRPAKIVMMAHEVLSDDSPAACDTILKNIATGKTVIDHLLRSER